jgi:hypothetical protein
MIQIAFYLRIDRRPSKLEFNPASCQLLRRPEILGSFLSELVPVVPVWLIIGGSDLSLKFSTAIFETSC